jgi:two-component system chemotaxis response regulator CheB
VKKKLRVLVVDDSEVCRELLRDIVEADGDMEVVGEADDGELAVSRVIALRPDVVTLDVEMPRVDGLRAVERIMAEAPVPILVVTGRPTAKQGITAFEAVRRGALDLVAKPAHGRDAEASELRRTIRLIAGVPVMKHVSGSRIAVARAVPLPAHVRVVGIGASAGGPSAIATVLSKIPRDFGPCIVIVQHVLVGFADAFADFLRAHSPQPVQVVRKPIALGAGVFVAPDDAHLRAKGDGFEPFVAPPVDGHRPSADVLFESLATVHGSRAIGVVLSGMGKDGTRGLAAMRRAGAETIAQDASAAIDGMPRSARESGAAARVLPASEIADAIVRATRRS